MTDLVRLTQMTDKDCRSLIYFFASLASDAQVKIMAIQHGIINRRRADMTKQNRADFFLATLVLAVSEFKANAMRSRRRTASPAELAAIDELRIDHLKRRNPKSPCRDFLIRHAALLRKLRQDGLSWRLMSQYFKLYHRKDISPSYLRQLFSELRL